MALAWPHNKMATHKNQNKTSAKLTILIILRRLTSPCRWTNTADLLYIHPSHKSEGFWEGLKRFNQARNHLPCDYLSAAFLSERAHAYATAVHTKCPRCDQKLAYVHAGRCFSFLGM